MRYDSLMILMIDLHGRCHPTSWNNLQWSILFTNMSYDSLMMIMINLHGHCHPTGCWWAWACQRRPPASSTGRPGSTSKSNIQNNLTNWAFVSKIACLESYSVTLAGESGWTWILGGEFGSAFPATTQLEVWNAYLRNKHVWQISLKIQTVCITCIFYHRRGQSPWRACSPP